MSKQKQKHQKSIQQYRRDIFALKQQLKDEELRLTELKQKYQDAEVFGDASYTFSMKLKILQYNLNDIRGRVKKFSGQEEFEYYWLNFATLGLIKSCEIVGITKEMIFRGVDTNNKGQVGYFQFVTFLKEVMHLDSQFTTPLMKVLCPDQSQPVTKQRYDHFLASFMIQSEQTEESPHNLLEESIMRVARELLKQSVSVESIWSVREVNIAMVICGLLKASKFLDVLDCVSVYCRCDPLKSGVISVSGLTNLLKQRMADCQNYEKGGVQFKLAKN